MSDELDAQSAAELALEEWLASEDGCDCVTCIVREVLTAADPYLYRVDCERDARTE